VSRGAFTECTISIEIAPVLTKGVRPTWDVQQNRSLFVLGAAIRFSHSRRQRPPYP
jgi:hypothetical protein